MRDHKFTRCDRCGKNFDPGDDYTDSEPPDNSWRAFCLVAEDNDEDFTPVDVEQGVFLCCDRCRPSLERLRKMSPKDEYARCLIKRTRMGPGAALPLPEELRAWTTSPLTKKRPQRKPKRR